VPTWLCGAACRRCPDHQRHSCSVGLQESDQPETHGGPDPPALSGGPLDVACSSKRRPVDLARHQHLLCPRLGRFDHASTSLRSRGGAVSVPGLIAMHVRVGRPPVPGTTGQVENTVVTDVQGAQSLRAVLAGSMSGRRWSGLDAPARRPGAVPGATWVLPLRALSSDLDPDQPGQVPGGPGSVLYRFGAETLQLAYHPLEVRVRRGPSTPRTSSLTVGPNRRRMSSVPEPEQFSRGVCPPRLSPESSLSGHPEHVVVGQHLHNSGKRSSRWAARYTSSAAQNRWWPGPRKEPLQPAEAP